MFSLPKTEQEETEQQSPFHASEEQLQQRLIQLLNLPVHHHTVAAPPFLATHPNSADTFSEDSPDQFSSLDTAALAESLSSMSLHQMLDIDVDLVELCEMEAQPGSASAAATSVGLPEIDLSVCAKKRGYSFKFEAPSKSSLVAGMGSDVEDKELGGRECEQKERRGGGGGDEVLEKLLAERTSVTSVAAASSVVRRVEVDCSQEDEALDRLLGGVGAVVVVATTQKKAPPPQQQHAPPPQQQQQQQQQQHALIPPTTQAGTSAGQTLNTAELDDMLDELLS